METIETAKTEQQAQKLVQALKNRNFELQLVTDGELKFYHPENEETVIVKRIPSFSKQNLSTHDLT